MAKARPEAVYAETPRLPTSFEAGYPQITYRDLANAINDVAWALDKQLGPGKRHETLAYVGPNNLAYIVILLGAVKAGYKVCDGLVGKYAARDHRTEEKHSCF